MAPVTRDIGRETRRTGKVSCHTRMEIYMMESGRRTRLMGRGPTNTRMVLATRASGSRTSKRAGGSSHGLMGQGTRGYTKMGKSTERVHFISPMEAYTQEPSIRMKYQDMVNISGPTAKPTRASGKLTRCTGKAPFTGETERDTQENSRMI